ncbi:MAG: CoB--CoM heterodisulfide reductase subunit B, partial [Candidatus Magnetoglobus multicellularis str. Araruama]
MQLKYSYFPGCKISGHLPEYGKSTLSLMTSLNIHWVSLPFNCCGYPIRHQNMEASVFSAARNIALSEHAHLDIMTPCKCCFGNLKHSQHLLKNDPVLFKSVNERLKQEGLTYSGNIEIKHLLSLLYHDVGLDQIKDNIRHPFESKPVVAASYGCHALRPAKIMNFDHPFDPTIFEKIIETTGAETVFWPKRSECCGQPVFDRNPSLSRALLQSKLSDAIQSGADMICTACTYCQIQYDTFGEKQLPVVVISLVV